MARIIVTGEVQDADDWEKEFRTHAELFRSQTISSPMRFTVTGERRFAIYSEATDPDKFMEVLNSQATQDAMINDGVKRESVQVYVLDKELEL